MIKEPEAVIRALAFWEKQRGEQTAQGSRADNGDTHWQKRSIDLLNDLGLFNNDHIAVSGAKILVGPDNTFYGNDLLAFGGWALVVMTRSWVFFKGSPLPS